VLVIVGGIDVFVGGVVAVGSATIASAASFVTSAATVIATSVRKAGISAVGSGGDVGVDSPGKQPARRPIRRIIEIFLDIVNRLFMLIFLHKERNNVDPMNIDQFFEDYQLLV
jgi:hypothetical protein